MKKLIVGATGITPVGAHYTDRYGRYVRTQSSYAQLCKEAESESDRDVWC